jgi:hypothetical protein
VTDAVDALMTAAESDRIGEAYNVGSGGLVSVNELIRQLGSPPTVQVPKRPGEPDCTWADIAKIRRDLGWRPKVKFADGVRIMRENRILTIGAMRRCGPCPGWRRPQAIGFAFSAKKAETSRRDDGWTFGRPSPSAGFIAAIYCGIQAIVGRPQAPDQRPWSSNAGGDVCRWRAESNRCRSS